MRARRTLVVTLAAGALLLPPTTAHAAPPPPAVDLGREVLAPGDGWASYEGPTVPDGKPTVATGTTGGADASPSEVYVVDTWQELRDALAGKPGGSQTDARRNVVPRIVYVTGTITASDPAACDAFAAQVTVSDTGEPFRMADYIAHFDPTGPWGRVKPSGPLEDARIAAAAVQAAQTLQHVGSNVTLVGVGDGREDRRREHADPRRPQRHRAEPHPLRRLRLLPGLGPDRHGGRQLELRLRQRVGVDVHERLGGPQHLRRRRPPAQRAPDRLRPAVRGARRAARHHARLGPGDGLLEPARRARQDRAHRLVGLPAPGPRPAPGHAAPQPLDRHRPARAPRAVRRRAPLRQPLHADHRGTVPVLLGRRDRVEHRRGEQRVRAGAAAWTPHGSSRGGAGRSCSRPAPP